MAKLQDRNDLRGDHQLRAILKDAPDKEESMGAVITVKNKTEDRVILDMIEKMIDNGYVVRIARTGMRTHASAVTTVTGRENRFAESGGLTNAIAELAKKVFQ